VYVWVFVDDDPTLGVEDEEIRVTQQHSIDLVIPSALGVDISSFSLSFCFTDSLRFPNPDGEIVILVLDKQITRSALGRETPL
jgi:hypothetical protein